MTCLPMYAKVVEIDDVVDVHLTSHRVVIRGNTFEDFSIGLVTPNQSIEFLSGHTTGVLADGFPVYVDSLGNLDYDRIPNAYVVDFADSIGTTGPVPVHVKVLIPFVANPDGV